MPCQWENFFFHFQISLHFLVYSLLTKEIPFSFVLASLCAIPSAMYLHLHILLYEMPRTPTALSLARQGLFAPVSTFLKRNIYQINTLEDYLNLFKCTSSPQQNYINFALKFYSSRSERASYFAVPLWLLLFTDKIMCLYVHG